MAGYYRDDRARFNINCVKDAAGRMLPADRIDSPRAGRLDPDFPPTPTIAKEATTFTGIYDHLRPHAEKVKVVHPPMLRASTRAT